MAQIFPEWANGLPKIIGGLLGALAVLGTAAVWYFFSPRYTDVGYQPEQPVPFSHELHAGALAMDCRYCHTTVEISPVASVPPTQVCMNCHRMVGRELESLALVRESAAAGEPIHWIRVHDMPDYAHFDHSLHLRAGVGCSTCHGDVAQMAQISQVEPLSMGWCLDCHRDPAPHLRPRQELTALDWRAPAEQAAFAERVTRELELAPPTDCSGCHR